LLEVPGPEGGYPISLAYHGGIMPAQDASWVGLGWNLNPGCINRTPNNFADDYNGGWNNGATSSTSDYWNGGVSTSYSLGVGVTFMDAVSVGVNVGVQHDTYQGTSGEFGIQIGSAIEDTKLGGGVGAQIQTGKSGGASITGFLGNNSTGLGLQLTAGSQGGQSFGNVSLVSNVTQSSMGLDLSSAGTKFSATPTSMFIGRDDRAGQISTQTSGMNIMIPIEDFYVSLGYKYTRYWSGTNQTTVLFGALNSQAGYSASVLHNPNNIIGEDVSYDCSVLMDPGKGMAEQTDINWTTNASLPCYDNYIVTGQGISGAIEPVVLDNGSLFRANYYDYSFSGNSQSSNGMHFQSAFPRPFIKTKHFFRFKNDFSNSHVLTQTNFAVASNNWPYMPNTDLGYTVNNIDSRGYTKTLNSSNQVTEARFAGSKHVEFYTNAEITAGTARTNGFINSPDVVPADRLTKQLQPYAYNVSYNVTANIGGYTITNEKGISYHYALPVYTANFGQTIQASSTVVQQGILTRTLTTPAPYAYAWMLTAVTGPDYVDCNANGYADGADWGYWVSFDYGKFQANAGYRTPETGSTTDIDGSTIYSWGSKEIYYLDAISTRTHTALFIKDVRNDGKGTEQMDYKSLNTQTYGSNTFPATNTLKLREVLLIDNVKLNSVFTQYVSSYNANNLFSTNLAALKNLNPVTCAASGSYTVNSCDCVYQSYSGLADQSNPGYVDSYTGYILQSLYPNVLDMGDMNVNGSTTNPILGSIKSLAQKDIVLGYDYSLCPNTTNSFTAEGQPATGRLTLNSLTFNGNNGVQLMPATTFQYDLPAATAINAQITLLSASSTNNAVWNISTNAGFAVGDILKFTLGQTSVPYNSTGTLGSTTYYGTLIGTITGGFQILFFGPNVPNSATFFAANTVVWATQTKNPPYAQSFTDLWGFFKSDYNPNNGVTNINKLMATTPVSAMGVDCWSLRSIQTPTGAIINIQYQSDDYDDVVLKNYSIFNVNTPSIQMRITGTSSYFGVDYQNITSGSDEPYTYTYFGNENSTLGMIARNSMDYVFTINNGDLQYPLTNYIKVNDYIYVVASIGYFSNPDPSYDASVVYNVPTKIKVKVTAVTANTVSVTEDPNNVLIANPITNTLNNGNTFSIGQGSFAIYAAYIIPNRTSYNFVPGGGVRASTISVTDGNTVKTSNYQYGNTSNSFGSTAYEPNSMSELIPLQPESIMSIAIERSGAPDQYQQNAVNAYSDAYYQSYNTIMAFAKDLTAPGVIYRNVLVSGSVTKGGVTTNAPVYQNYQFQPFTASMVQSQDLMTDQNTTFGTQSTDLRTIQITNWMSQLGNLLSVKSYDRNGNLLTETANTYTSTPPNNQGFVDQVFNEQRKMDPNGGNEHDFGIVTIKSERPSVLQSTTVTDYVKGLSNTTTNTAFDFYSGAVTETQTQDSYGNTYISITEPAYNYYTYYNTTGPGTTASGMGVKLINGTWNNANMLTQTAANYTLRSTGTTASYPCTVTAVGSNFTEFNVSMSSGLPMTYHIGSVINFPSSLTNPFPAYITSISDNRTSFNVVGSAVQIYFAQGTFGGAKIEIPELAPFPTGSMTLTLNQGTLLSASVNTWNNMWNYRQWNGSNAYVTAAMTDNTLTVQNENVWRQKSDYTWNSPYVNPDGSYIINSTATGAFVPFAFTADYGGTAQTSAYWTKLNSSTLFSSNSKPLETMDVNGRYSSTKFCNNERYILGSATNAKYTEFTHSGGEYYDQGASIAEGEVLCYNNAFESSYFAHTGKQSFSLSSGDKIKYVIPYTSGTNLPSGFTTGINYRTSVWLNATNLANAQLYATVTDNGSITTSTVTAATVTNSIKCGNWYLLTLTFAGPVTTTSTNAIEVGVAYTGTGSTPVYADDFRFQPDVSSVTSYVYDPNTGLLTYVIDPTNRYTRYQYDCRNRLIGVYKETTYGEVTVKQYNYNYYSGPNVPPLTNCP